ncbi:MAG TPA: iron-containing alcohol dehydrogenase [Gemmataceae bacterium]|jgi:alcohol dehydrogenase class IV|nr:iron-containing alcohol dehydrogenase [Gemmataceae bacterium]
MRTTFTFRSAGHLLFGRHAVRELGSILDRIVSKRVFVITDKVLAKVGIVDQVKEAAGRPVEVFDGGEPEPSLGMIQNGIAAARAFRPDTIIGLGGGSNMDAAKLAAVVLGHGGDVRDYVGENKVPGPIMPLVCIPTTAGTGSEVSQAAVFTNTDIQLKVSVLSYYLRPAAAIVDPLLTVSCPPKVTADSGIDALTHAIEGFTAVDNATYPLPPGETSVYQGKNPLADMCAEKAITLVGRFLRRAVRDGNDLEARDGMALAATLGGLAFSNAGVALVHAMEYPVGAAVHVSHGAGNGLLLPFVMRYNSAARQEEFGYIAELLGDDTTGESESEAADEAISAVERLKKDIGIPVRLRDIGVKETMLASFAEKAFSFKRLMRVNPRYPTQAEIEAIYRAAW